MIKEQKMIYMSDAAWDPSGKFLLTASYTTKTYTIWNCFGKMIFKDTVIFIFQILKDVIRIDWRPRLHFKISESTLKKIDQDLENIYAKYRDQDDKILNKAKHEQAAREMALKKEVIFL